MPNARFDSGATMPRPARDRGTFAYLGGHIVMRGADSGYVMGPEQESNRPAEAAARARATRLIEND